eukprot:1160059-Pelagomonas_calceolata.AAC.4
MACQGVAVVIVATHLALAGPAPPEEQATVSVSGCFAGEHSTHLMVGACTCIVCAGTAMKCWFCVVPDGWMGNVMSKSGRLITPAAHLKSTASSPPPTKVKCCCWTIK